MSEKYKFSLQSNNGNHEIDELTLDIMRYLMDTSEAAYRRRRKRNCIIPITPCNEVYITLHNMNPPLCVEEIMEQRERNRELHDAVNKLPAAQARRIRLHYFAGFSVREIARMEDCGERVVQKSLQRARKNLKKLL